MDASDSKAVSLPFNDENFHSKINQFNSLMKAITLTDMEASPEERRQIMADTLRFDYFCAQLTALFGEDNINGRDLKVLFRKISNNPDARTDWCELFGYQDSGLATDDDSVLPPGGEVNVFAINMRNRAGNVSMEKRRLDTTRSIVYCKQLDTYIAASKKGIITQWNMKLENVYCAEMPVTAWLVSCSYLPNFKKLICCTERGLVVWDHKSKLKTMEFYMISSFENAFTSMALVPSSDPLCEIILLGDDKGYITMVTLSALDLMRKNTTDIKKSPDGSRTTMILSQQNLITSVRRRKVHTDWVLMLQWVDELHSFISCSPSDIHSLVIDELSTLYSMDKLRSAKVFRGVNTFVYSNQANIVASAGCDKIVRIWHPSILAKPTGRLIGHLFTIVALQVNEKDQHIISLSSARVFRVWCINSMTCLQIFTDNDDRAGERRIQSMLYDQKHQRLLTGSGVIDAWSLTRTVMNTLVIPQTHERSIVQVLFNEALNQFISLCTEPIIRVWDGESCNVIYQMSSPHGVNSEVTCMSVSLSGYRLATGATDGSIKIWDLGAGQEVKYWMEKVPYGEEPPVMSSVLSLQFVSSPQDKQRLLVTSGWNNELRLYSDADNESELILLKMFSDHYIRFSSLSRTSTLVSSFTSLPKLPPVGVTLTTGHKGRSKRVLDTEQVTCIGLLPLTGSSNQTLLVGTHTGSIILWDTQTTNITNVFMLAETSKSKHSDILNSQPNKSIHMIGAIKRSKNFPQSSCNSMESSVEVENSSQKTKKLSPSENAGGGYPVLIFSLHEDSGIRLWTTDGQMVEETVAMTRSTGVAVTCYVTDSTNNRLITGDVLGYVTVWEVSELLLGISDSIQQVVSWRAHNSRVTSAIVRPHKTSVIIYTASADGSIRIWFDSTCRYLGYLGQSIPVTLPSVTDTSPSMDVALPCDIKEKPIFAPSKKRRLKRVRLKEIDVPLVSTLGRGSSSNKQSRLGRVSNRNRVSTESVSGDTKFFKSLSKPAHYNNHLEPIASLAKLKQSPTSGFVFRSLPVYRISTPKSISYPKSSLRNVESITHSHPKLPTISTRVAKK